jgi:hypothetical protein
MYLKHGKKEVDDICGYNSGFRRSKDWRFYVHAAKNLAQAVAGVHAINQVIGDLNDKNILISPDNAEVTLIDVDSFHITAGDKKNKVTHRCAVGMSEFIAPEIHGINFRDSDLPTFTEQTDNFSLAILIFKLLMNGVHPFNSVGVDDNSIEDNIKEGLFPYDQEQGRNEGANTPFYAPPFTMLPDSLKGLFKRAFVTGAFIPQRRPSAQEFFAELETLADENNLYACTEETWHIFPNVTHECPWCEVDRRLKERTEQIAALSVLPDRAPDFTVHKNVKPAVVDVIQPEPEQSTVIDIPSASGYSAPAPALVRRFAPKKLIAAIGGGVALLALIIVIAASSGDDGEFTPWIITTVGTTRTEPGETALSVELSESESESEYATGDTAMFTESAESTGTAETAGTDGTAETDNTASNTPGTTGHTTTRGTTATTRTGTGTSATTTRTGTGTTRTTPPTTTTPRTNTTTATTTRTTPPTTPPTTTTPRATTPTPTQVNRTEVFNMRTDTLLRLFAGAGSANQSTHPLLRSNSGTREVNIAANPRTITITNRGGTSQGIEVDLIALDAKQNRSYQFDFVGRVENPPGATNTPSSHNIFFAPALPPYPAGTTGTMLANTTTATGAPFVLSHTLTHTQIAAYIAEGTTRVRLGGASQQNLIITGMIITEIG